MAKAVPGFDRIFFFRRARWSIIQRVALDGNDEICWGVNAIFLSVAHKVHGFGDCLEFFMQALDEVKSMICASSSKIMQRAALEALDRSTRGAKPLISLALNRKREDRKSKVLVPV